MPPIFLSTVDVRDSFAAVLDRAALGRERVVVTRHGEPLAAIVPLEDLELLEELERRVERRQASATARPLRRETAERGRDQIRLFEAD